MSSVRIRNSYSDNSMETLDEIRAFYEHLFKEHVSKDTNRKNKNSILSDEIFPTLSDEDAIK